MSSATRTPSPTTSAEPPPRSLPDRARRGASLAPRAAPAALREIALVVAAVLAYFGIRNLTVGAAAEAFANADRLVRLEEHLRLAWERALQDALLGHDALVTFFNWIYIWGHWPVIITAGIVLYRTRPDRYLAAPERDVPLGRDRLSLLRAAAGRSAPPRRPALIDTVTLHSEAYRALQPPGLTNQYAAFPSLHFGWNLLVGIAVWGATTNSAPAAALGRSALPPWRAPSS